MSWTVRGLEAIKGIGVLQNNQEATESVCLLSEGLSKGGEDEGGGLVLLWHLVGMPLSSRGSAEKEAGLCVL